MTLVNQYGISSRTFHYNTTETKFHEHYNKIVCFDMQYCTQVMSCPLFLSNFLSSSQTFLDYLTYILTINTEIPLMHQ